MAVYVDFIVGMFWKHFERGAGAEMPWDLWFGLRWHHVGGLCSKAGRTNTAYLGDVYHCKHLHMRRWHSVRHLKRKAANLNLRS